MADQAHCAFSANPELSTVGTRVAFYVQATLLPLLAARCKNKHVLVSTASCVIGMFFNMAYSIAALVLGVTSQATLYDGMVVLHLLWPSSLMTIISFAVGEHPRHLHWLYHLHTGLVFSISFVILGIADKFGANPECNSDLKFFILYPIQFMDIGRYVCFGLWGILPLLYICDLYGLDLKRLMHYTSRSVTHKFIPLISWARSVAHKFISLISWARSVAQKFALLISRARSRSLEGNNGPGQSAAIYLRTTFARNQLDLDLSGGLDLDLIEELDLGFPGEPRLDPFGQPLGSPVHEPPPLRYEADVSANLVLTLLIAVAVMCFSIIITELFRRCNRISGDTNLSLVQMILTLPPVACTACSAIFIFGKYGLYESDNSVTPLYIAMVQLPSKLTWRNISSNVSALRRGICGLLEGWKDKSRSKCPWRASFWKSPARLRTESSPLPNFTGGILGGGIFGGGMAVQESESPRPQHDSLGTVAAEESGEICPPYGAESSPPPYSTVAVNPSRTHEQEGVPDLRTNPEDDPAPPSNSSDSGTERVNNMVLNSRSVVPDRDLRYMNMKTPHSAHFPYNYLACSLCLFMLTYVLPFYMLSFLSDYPDVCGILSRSLMYRKDQRLLGSISLLFYAPFIPFFSSEGFPVYSVLLY